MFGIGLQELLVILAIILVLFGGKKLPELSKSISSAIKELRKGFSDPLDSDNDKQKTAEKPKEHNS